MGDTVDLAGLRAKAALFDELVEQLAVCEDEIERLRECDGDDVDAVWRDIAIDLAQPLRPYSMFREPRVVDGRIVVETAVPGQSLRLAREALDRLGRQFAVESYRRSGIPVAEDDDQRESRAAA